MMKKAKYINPNEYINDIVKEFQTISYSHGISTVFTDYITMVSCAISNSIDKLHFDEREKLYTETIKKYTDEERKNIFKLHGKIVTALNEKQFKKDVLGDVFHALRLSNSWNGQYFTPMNVANCMALMVVGNMSQEMKDKGYAKFCEPSCGSGVMIIAAADAVCQANLNPSKNMCVLAVDNDIRCAMMSYIQLSYLGIPAVVIHGDSLRNEEYTRFYTPIYVLNGWLWKEPMSLTNQICDGDIKLSNIMFDFMGKSKDDNIDLTSEKEGKKKDA